MTKQNPTRNHEDVLMSIVRCLWDSPYGNDFIAGVMTDLAARVFLMEVEND